MSVHVCVCPQHVTYFTGLSNGLLFLNAALHSWGSPGKLQNLNSPVSLGITSILGNSTPHNLRLMPMLIVNAESKVPFIWQCGK